jgi:hypothetical protein
MSGVSCIGHGAIVTRKSSISELKTDLVRDGSLITSLGQRDGRTKIFGPARTSDIIHCSTMSSAS